MRRGLLIFEPPDGGVADHVARLALGLQAHGWQPTVAGPPDSNAYAELQAAGVEIRRLPFRRGLRHPVSDARVLAETVRLVRRERFDLVHGHSSKGGAVARVAAMIARVPSVYTPNCFPFVVPSSDAARRLAGSVERLLGRRTAALICVAEQERRLALEWRVARGDRLHVIHNGTDSCDGAGLDADLAAFRGDGPLAATLTVLRPQKAIHTFLDAAPEVLRRVPGARLAVIGDGELRGELEQHAASLGLGDRLRFFDFSPPPSRQLASIDVFVLPSAWEAFPIAILEAMACGVPQVATDVGGTAEAVADGETGLLCQPGDVSGLAERVASLLSDQPRRAAMSDASRRRHRERFTVDRMVRETAALYDRVVETAAR